MGLLEKTLSLPEITKQQFMAVVKAEDEAVLKAVKQAGAQNGLYGVLIGSKRKIEAMMKSLDIPVANIEIVDEEAPQAAANLAVSLAKRGEADFIMKGMISTKEFLKAVLADDKALINGGLLSHVGVFEVPSLNRLLLISDAAMNINPNLREKYGILKNSLKVAEKLRISKPKAAILSAIEHVNPAISSTTDAAILCKMAERDNLEAIVDGPLALDIAISVSALRHKGITSSIGGEADILIVPELVSGNVLYKSLIYLAGARVAGIVAGAKVPIVLTSRADSDESKALSIAMGRLMA